MNKKNNNKPKEIEFPGVKVISDEYIDVTREHDPNDEWSGEDTFTSREITGLEISKTKYCDERLNSLKILGYKIPEYVFSQEE